MKQRHFRFIKLLNEFVELIDHTYREYVYRVHYLHMKEMYEL